MIPLFSEVQIENLKSISIAIFGLGGVGGYALEALARTGIGKFHLVDGDVIESSNINRQILALNSTMGEKKVDVAKKRVEDINSSAIVHTYFRMVKPNDVARLDLPFLDEVDAIIDATDDIALKASLALEAEIRNILIVSSGGTGNRLHSSFFEIIDIYKTKNCPLCRSLRHRLKKMGIKKLPILCSKESPRHFSKTVSSLSWVPSVAGLHLAEYIILNLNI